jgi:hypothetical protein
LDRAEGLTTATVRGLATNESQDSNAFEVEHQALYVEGDRYQRVPKLRDIQDVEKLHLPSLLMKRVYYHEISHFFIVLAAPAPGEYSGFIYVVLFPSLSYGPLRNARKATIKLL